MPIVPGVPVTPSSIDGSDISALTVDQITQQPTASSAGLIQTYNHSYALYVDNTGAGTNNTRLWIDCPNDGQVVIGPRAGASTLEVLTLRTDATTASAANLFIDSTSYQIKRSISSIKYKVDVKDAKIDTEKLLELRPVTFRDRGEAEAGGAATRRYLGFIAEEVHDLGLTQYVAYRETEDGPVPDGLQYDRFTVGLIALAKEQKQRIDTLEKRLAALEKKVGK